MDLACLDMKNKKNQAYINRYELIEALFEAEDHENDYMHSELNEMYNYFCQEELQQRRNITELIFEITKSNKSVIDFIKTVNQEY